MTSIILIYSADVIFSPFSISNIITAALGAPATIPAKMIMEIPFPIPVSVIFSPSHISTEVPAVKEKITIKNVKTSNFPESANMLYVADLILKYIMMDWNNARASVM